MSDSINERLRRGEMVAVGGKLLVVCQECRTIVQVNKWLVGSLHICTPVRGDGVTG
jgi:hypothetical protein